MRGKVTQTGTAGTPGPSFASPGKSASRGVGAAGLGYGLVGQARDRSGMQGTWHPTVVYLLLLVLAEMAAFAGLRYAFKATHGG